MISNHIYYIRRTALAAVVCLAASLILGSCSHGRRALSERLDRAETMIDSVPDQVLTLLTDSACASLLPHATDEQSARHALLLTQAQFKCYTPPASDSAIAYAVKIFDRKDDEPRLVRALYYLARVQKNAGDYPAAIISAMKSHSLAVKIHEDFWGGRTADVLSSIYRSTFSHDEALQYARIASNYFRKAGDDSFYLFAKADEASCQSHLENFEEASRILDSIASLPSVDNHLRDIILTIGQSVNYEKGDYLKAEWYGDSLVGLPGAYPEDLSSLAKVKIKLGKIDEAMELINANSKILETMGDSMHYYMALIDLHEIRGEWREAYEEIQKELTWQNEVASAMVKQSAVKAQRDYYSGKVVNAEEKATRNLHITIFVVVCSVLLILLIFFIARSRSNKKNERISKNMAEIVALTSQLKIVSDERKILSRRLAENSGEVETLTDMISNQQSDILALSDTLSGEEAKNVRLYQMTQALLKNQFSHLNMIVSEYYDQADDKNYKVFYKNICREIERFKQPERIKELSRILDICKDGIITRMREQLPMLSETDFTFIVFTLAGFSARAIGLFTDVHANSTYRRKKTLINTISNSSATDKEFFIKELTTDYKSVL